MAQKSKSGNVGAVSSSGNSTANQKVVSIQKVESTGAKVESSAGKVENKTTKKVVAKNKVAAKKGAKPAKKSANVSKGAKTAKKSAKKSPVPNKAAKSKSAEKKAAQKSAAQKHSVALERRKGIFEEYLQNYGGISSNSLLQSVDNVSELNKKTANSAFECLFSGGEVGQVIAEEIYNCANDIAAQNMDIAQESFACTTLSDFVNLYSELYSKNAQKSLDSATRISDASIEFSQKVDIFADY